ncbi:hypothetical protein L4D00_14920 [Photobacterium swingsii]|uniref:hypothetical protein n=1 Tax=Photobacterium swingsii TaxID=680026 RepID=UPI003D1163F4
MKIERGESPISIYRGDTATYRYQLTDENEETGEETVIDITDATIRGQVRYSPDSPEIWFELPIEKHDPKNGHFKWSITKEQSENLLPVGSFEPDTALYDIQIELNGAVFTFLYGSFVVTRDITRV